MAATVFTGWRNVTPGPCNVCGSTDDYDCDGRGTVYCSCQCCAACGAFDGHDAGCSEASDGATHWSYGSGMTGCLYDGGPGFAETKADAIEAVLSSFFDLSEGALACARAGLEQDGIYHFPSELCAGADYVEVTELDGPCPDDDA